MIRVTVNGKVKELPGPQDLMTFLRENEVDGRYYAVAYNGEVLRKEAYPRIRLKDGDVLEIVRPVGGG